MKQYHRRIYSLLVILLLISTCNLHGFSTLSQATALANTLAEFPPSEGEDKRNPRYDHYHEQRVAREHSLVNRLLSFVGLRKNLWDNQEFITLVKNVTQQRLSRAMQGDFLQKITVQSGNKLVLFSNLHGAFHSLVRDLNHLKVWGIIDDNFVIKDNRCYIIINGNAIARSPYNLETLQLLLNLLNANPERVIYVRGDEEFGRWVDYDVPAELRIRIGVNGKPDIPLKKELDAFFSTLPLALYVAHGQGKSVQFICFSHLKDTGGVLDRSNYLDFLMQSPDGVHPMKGTVKQQPEDNLLVLFKEGEPDSELFFKRGLSLWLPENGRTRWDLLSCPTKAYHDVLVYDSFAVIDTQADMNSWAIMHYSQNVLKQEPLVVNIYDLLTGSKLYSKQFGQQETSKLLALKDLFALPTLTTKVPAFYVGSTMDLSAEPRFGQGEFEGFSVRINQENLRGGVHKQFLKFFCFDDQYSVAQSYNNTLTMLARGIDTHVMLMGAQAFLATINLLEQNKIIVLFPEAGIVAARRASLTNVVHFVASYNDEVRTLLHQALDVMKVRKIALFYQDDAFGRENRIAAEKFFKKREFTDYLSVAYKKGAINLRPEAEKISTFNPDTLIFFAVPSMVTMLINTIGLANISSMHLMSVHDISFQDFTDYLKIRGFDMMLTDFVPNPNDARLPIVAAYQEAMRAQGYTIFNGYSLLGYINATLLIEVLKKIRGRITKEKILSGFETMKNFDLGGIHLNFDPEKRSLGHHVWLIYKNKWTHFSRAHNGDIVEKKK